jgi:hypothetical protein
MTKQTELEKVQAQAATEAQAQANEATKESKEAARKALREAEAEEAKIAKEAKAKLEAEGREKLLAEVNGMVVDFMASQNSLMSMFERELSAHYGIKPSVDWTNNGVAYSEDQQLEEARQNARDWQERAESYEQDIKDGNEIVAKLRSQVEELIAQNAQLTSDVENVGEPATDNSEVIANMQATIDSLEEAAEYAEERDEQQQRKIDSLEETVAQYEKENPVEIDDPFAEDYEVKETIIEDSYEKVLEYADTEFDDKYLGEIVVNNGLDNKKIALCMATIIVEKKMVHGTDPKPFAKWLLEHRDYTTFYTEEQYIDWAKGYLEQDKATNHSYVDETPQFIIDALGDTYTRESVDARYKEFFNKAKADFLAKDEDYVVEEKGGLF